jgi:hypothetical protein
MEDEVIDHLGDQEDDPCPVLLDGKYFKIIDKSGKNIKAKCLACTSKDNVLSGSTTSNFLKHVKVTTHVVTNMNNS